MISRVQRVEIEFPGLQHCVAVDRESGTSRDFDFVNSGRRVNIYLKRSAEIVDLVGCNDSLGVLLERIMTVWEGVSLHAAFLIR